MTGFGYNVNGFGSFPTRSGPYNIAYFLSSGGGGTGGATNGGFNGGAGGGGGGGLQSVDEVEVNPGVEI